MLIRKILKSDIKSCAKVYQEVFNHSLWKESWSYEEAVNRLEYIYKTDGFIGLVAIYENSVLGFVLGNIEPYTKGNAFYLREMCVKTQKQNEGIGNKLIINLHNELKKTKVIISYLITQQNSSASNFYKKMATFIKQVMEFMKNFLSK